MSRTADALDGIAWNLLLTRIALVHLEEGKSLNDQEVSALKVTAETFLSFKTELYQESVSLQPIPRLGTQSSKVSYLRSTTAIREANLPSLEAVQLAEFGEMVQGIRDLLTVSERSVPMELLGRAQVACENIQESFSEI